MLQCNLTKNDESTFFVLDIDWVFVQNWVLPYINENAKRSAASILMLYIHKAERFLFYVTPSIHPLMSASISVERLLALLL